MKKIFVFFMLFGLGFAFGQQRISYNGSGNYELVERTDLRRYDNGRYKGLVSREVSAFIIPSDFDNGFLYDGTFWVLENTRRNGFDVDFGVDEGIPAKFRIGADGQMSMIVDNGFPSYRSFPTFPSEDISIGDSWEAQAVRAVDPLYKGIVTRMPVMVRYTYSGDSVFNGEDVFVINAQWATRYGMGTGSYYIDFGGDGELRRASGSHRATIYVSKASGNSVLIRDNVDETFVYSDGNQIRFKGTVSLFTKYPPAVDRMKFLPALKRVAGLSDEQVEELMSPVVDSWGGTSGGHSPDTGNSAGIGGSTGTGTGHSTSIVDSTDIGDSAGIGGSTSIVDSGFYGADFDDIFGTDGKDEKKTSNDDINIKVENTPAGIRLTMENLQFLPDSAQLIPGQLGKLDEIAEVLKSVPGGMFLIEGHTASTGYEEGEMKLSIERAESIAREFSARGINRSNIICRGSGGTKPVADNKTPSGKAKNRRVEITILD